MNPFKQKSTPLDEIKEKLSFLESDYGFKLLETQQDNKYSGEYLAIYRNNNSKLQLEISADDDYFHCEIRRLLDGEPAKYSDKENCIGFESLAILESNNNYEHLDYFAGGRNGFQGVLNNTANLFLRHKDFFTTDRWIDIAKIEELRDKDFEKRFGSKPDRNKPTYFGELKRNAIKYLTNKNFIITQDSDELPPYDSDSMTTNIVFESPTMTIKISAVDWRDYYYIYYLQVNEKKVFEIDLSQHTDINEAVELTMQKVKQIT